MMESFIFNPWTMAFIGFVTYNLILLSNAKDPYDDEGKSWDIRTWWRGHWDNALLAFWLSLVWVIAGPAIFEAHQGPEAQWSDVLYLAAPIFIQKVREYFKKK